MVARRRAAWSAECSATCSAATADPERQNRRMGASLPAIPFLLRLLPLPCSLPSALHSLLLQCPRVLASCRRQHRSRSRARPRRGRSLAPSLNSGTTKRDREIARGRCCGVMSDNAEAPPRRIQQKAERCLPDSPSSIVHPLAPARNSWMLPVTRCTVAVPGASSTLAARRTVAKLCGGEERADEDDEESGMRAS